MSVSNVPRAVLTPPSLRPCLPPRVSPGRSTPPQLCCGRSSYLAFLGRGQQHVKNVLPQASITAWRPPGRVTCFTAPITHGSLSRSGSRMRTEDACLVSHLHLAQPAPG
ncbi:hypothetical protein E2C01_094008 [Portunus trituberculatus]|uniref:Uncharacterized protein n=1 Tax=Portunus trituberculatus TaxID=210409 RepID=A0A5B7JRD0_PORTR|nr:hypothetical protein [Portunus trituberculatus]